MELTRISTAITEKTNKLKEILQQISVLDLDPETKKKMMDSCLNMIDSQTIGKMLNTELTETDSTFLSKLQKKFPNLNQRDMRVLPLVRLNHDTRDIAQSIGISTRGMESIRYRLHKKLGLEKHQSIKTYLSDFAISE
jgi:FixJ family two-component response regulator